MKRFLVFTLLLVVTLCVASIAFASTNHSLPSEIESYFSVGDSTILDYADLTGHGADDCWFVIIRTKEGTNILYCFKLKENGWDVAFRTSDAVPQTKRGLHINVGEDGYEGPAATYPYHRPLLFIGQDNEFGDHWDLCISFELQRGNWLLRRIWSYIGYDHMLFKDGSVTYYVDNENERVAGTVIGTVQRDLRYVSLSAIPRTLSEAKKKLTVAPDLPQSAELKVYPVTFAGKKKYDVYTAPDKSSIRGANGKARVSTNSWIQVFGTEGDWVLIQYSIDASHYRFGYISSSSLPRKANVPELSFDGADAWTVGETRITDDPLYSQTTLATLPDRCRVTWLATMGQWAYIESSTGDYLRGFVPVDSLSTSRQFDLCDIPMGETAILEGTLSVDPSSKTVSVRFRPIAGGALEDKTIESFELRDPVRKLHLASLYEKDQEGFYSGTFTISNETTSIQIMALPPYGTMDEWDGMKAITVEW